MRLLIPPADLVRLGAACFAAGVWPGYVQAAATSPVPAAEARLQAHVTFLADDLMEGRAAGTRGHGLAMNYVAAQFQRLGLAPAGDRGYQQRVALRESRLDLEAGRFRIRHGAEESELKVITDVVVRPAANSAANDVTAPAVFVGFGFHAPEFGYDDFAGGVEVRGRIAVVLAGSPARLPATARAHYSRSRMAELVRRGAVGLVTVETPEEEKRLPWALQANRGRFPTMRLVNPDGSLFEAFPELQATANVSRTAGAALFRHAPKAIEAVFAAAAKGEPQAFELGIEISLTGRAVVADAASANVLGWLAGTDAGLAGEPIVITSHLDHQGIGPAMNGDSLYNGAYDNALGTAVLLAVAEELAGRPAPRRPVLFASVTAEEKGLLGAYHLARQPPPRVRRFAASLNLDMPLVLAPVRDIIGIGAEHSTLGTNLAAAAARSGFSVSPDPNPEEVYFVRSDQYPFVRTGVPALYLKIGPRALQPGVDLAARQAEFRRVHYHKPSDDLSLPMDWPSAAALVQLAAEIVRSVADDPVPPAWRPGDFFGTRFGPERTAR